MFLDLFCMITKMWGKVRYITNGVWSIVGIGLDRMEVSIPLSSLQKDMVATTTSPMFPTVRVPSPMMCTRCARSARDRGMAKKIWYSVPLKPFWDKVYPIQKRLTPLYSDEQIYLSLVQQNAMAS